MQLPGNPVRTAVGRSFPVEKLLSDLGSWKVLEGRIQNQACC